MLILIVNFNSLAHWTPFFSLPTQDRDAGSPAPLGNLVAKNSPEV